MFWELADGHSSSTAWDNGPARSARGSRAVAGPGLPHGVGGVGQHDASCAARHKTGLRPQRFDHPPAALRGGEPGAESGSARLEVLAEAL